MVVRTSLAHHLWFEAIFHKRSYAIRSGYGDAAFHNIRYKPKERCTRVAIDLAEAAISVEDMGEGICDGISSGALVREVKNY